MAKGKRQGFPGLKPKRKAVGPKGVTIINNGVGGTSAANYPVYTIATLPTDLTVGQALGIVYVSDSNGGEMAFMNESTNWISLITGNQINALIDPSPSTYYTNTSPTAIATTTFAGEDVANLFDTSKSLTGAYGGQGWIGGSGVTTNTRVAVDLESAMNLFKIRMANYHDSGSGSTNGWGGQNIKIYSSVTLGDYVNTFNTVTGTMSLLYDGVLAKHTAVDEADWQEITLTGLAPLSAQYVIIDIADQYAGALLGMRAVEIG